MGERINPRDTRLGKQVAISTVGFSEAGAGNLLGFSGEFVGRLKQGEIKFEPWIVHQLADRMPAPYGDYWRRISPLVRDGHGATNRHY